MKELETLRSQLMSAVEKAGSLDDLEKIRVSALGKKGRITELMKGLGGMDPDSRKQAGQSLNALKAEIADAIEAKKRASADSELEARLARESVDVTLPVRPESEGYIHPISQTIDEVVAILGEMGLGVAEGPDIEDDWHNFTALNFPEGHPARETHDTFFMHALEGDAPADVMEPLGKQLAMHIAAAFPLALSADDIDPALLERERAIAIETMLNPELKPEERHARVELFKRRLVDLERMALRDQSLKGRNTRNVRRLFENYDLSFLIHASVEKNLNMLDAWLEQIGVSTQTVMSATTRRR